MWGACTTATGQPRRSARRPDVLFASIHQGGIYPGTGQLGDFGSRSRRGLHDQTCRSPPGSEEDLVAVAARARGAAGRGGRSSRTSCWLSAGFDAHRADPLASCRLETSSFAEMAAHTVRTLRRAGGCAAWRGGSRGDTNRLALAASHVCATLAALGSDEPPQSSAPEALLRPARAAAHVSHYWVVVRVASVVFRATAGGHSRDGALCPIRRALAS